jgi:acyl-CoA hydrolase
MSLLAKAMRSGALKRTAASIPVMAPRAGVTHFVRPDLAGLKGKKKTIEAASAVDALRPFLKPGQNVHLHMAASTPTDLIQGAVDMKDELSDMKFYHMTFAGPALHLEDSIPDGKFKSMAFFISPPIRPHVATGRAETCPAFFSEVPRLYRDGVVPLDVAFINVSPPDAHGWCSLGTSVDCAVAAVQTAKVVVASYNRTQPRTHGDGLIHVSAIDAAIQAKTPIYTSPRAEVSDIDAAIGKHCAELIPDGACLQIGIGTIPEAVLAQLTNHKDLGVHTELMSDGTLPLIRSGVINNRRKQIHTNQLVSTFLTGSRELFDFVNDNPEMQMLDVSHVNNPWVIARNDNVVALNSAIEVDLTGQVCADSIGTRMYSGIGGQMDFMRGAALSRGGKPIIAMPSCTAKGESKITPTLASGAGVVTTRGHVNYVVTEYGVAQLAGRSLQERARALISVAHPKHRDALSEACHKRFGKSLY